MSRWLSILILCAAAFVPAVIGQAQVGSVSPTPFFFSGTTSVEAQIGITTSGDVLSVPQATVSRDRKYVTMDANPSMTANLGIQEFKVSTSSMGFVGSAAAVRSVSAASSGTLNTQPHHNSLTPSIGMLPSDVALAKLSVLDQPGMTQIASLP